jgi:hypothetical protein
LELVRQYPGWEWEWDDYRELLLFSPESKFIYLLF